MSLSQLFEEIDDEDRSDLLVKYQSLIGTELSRDDVRTLRETVTQLAGFGVNLDHDGDRKARLEVAKIEAELEPEPADDAQAQHEAKIASLKEQMRETTIEQLCKSIEGLPLAEAAHAARKLAHSVYVPILDRQHGDYTRWQEETAFMKQIDAAETVSEIADICADLVRIARIDGWESQVRYLVKECEALDRKPILDASNAGNAELNALPEAPKEVAARNNRRRSDIARLKLAHPLAFAPPTPVEPPGAIDEPEASSEPAGEPQTEPETEMATESVADSELVGAQ